MITKQITSDKGIKGISIEIDGRGADFYQDGTYYAWDDNSAFNRCEATNQLTPYVCRNALQEAIKTAEKELGVTFAVSSIGIDVDNESIQQSEILPFFRVILTRLCDGEKWRIVTNPCWDHLTKAQNDILQNEYNHYAEYCNCGSIYRMIRAQDISEYLEDNSLKHEWTLDPRKNTHPTSPC